MNDVSVRSRPEQPDDAARRSIRRCIRRATRTCASRTRIPATKFSATIPAASRRSTPRTAKSRYIAGREVVGNFHFGIPHKRDAGRDDVQAALHVVGAVPPVLQQRRRRGTRSSRNALYTREGWVSQPAALARLLDLSGRHAVSGSRNVPADRLPVPRLAAPTAAPTSAAFPIACPDGTYSALPERLSRRALGHFEHRQAAVPEELRQQRVPAGLRLYVLLEHESQRRDAARHRQRLSARRTTTTRSTRTRAALQIHFARSDQRHRTR